ncbi:RNA polymerase-associated protein RapA [Candidatus Entotheonellaceae bacterium PAL068K]
MAKALELEHSVPSLRPRIGGFVQAPDNYGIGKLLEVFRGQGRVLFRQSAVVTEERCYALPTLRRTFLSPQTRVFWFDKENEIWRVGRVTDYDMEPDALVYTVRFPNRDDQVIPEVELETRSLLPNRDPAAALAEGWCETQFFYDRRLAALKVLIRARANSRGLTGLCSASIELLPHQLEVVRRVLMDPIQRYLLADEVGIGKTIEAGCVIRQCLLDSPNEHVVILAPSALVRQWERELQEKFAVHEFPGRLTVQAFDSLGELTPKDIDTLVIDEAHHLIGRAPAGTDLASSSKYQRLALLARACQRLLILSATPVLGNEVATLGLLHLLDPHTYHLTEIESFRAKLAKRQDYGRLLMALDPDASSFILKRLAPRLLEAFPQDDVIEALAAKLADPDPNTTPEDVQQTVRLLRRHIAETYRLHQRLLRTRRTDLEGWELLPRHGRLQTVAEQNPRLQLLWDHLEDWRYRSHVAGQHQTDSMPEHSLEAAFAERFLRLIEAMGRSTEDLAVEVERQWRDVTAGLRPTFEDEETILEPIRELLADVSASELWISLCVRTIRATLDGVQSPLTRSAKIVVFTSSSEFARQVVAKTAVTIGRDAVAVVIEGMSSDDVEEALERFTTSKRPMALLCDQSGEEGLNLHFADAIVHLDLPLAPSRIEQRIGRVDRFGRRDRSIHHVIILPDDDQLSPWMAWYELLRDGFQVFENSISDVQFLLETLQQYLTLALYREGTTVLTKAVARVRQELDSERARLDEQYALDRLAMADEEASLIFNTLETGDDRSLYQEVDRWLMESLRFRQQADPDIRHVFRFHWTAQTLIPREPWLEFFGAGLDRPLSYDRTVSTNHPGVALVRPGSALMEAVARHLLWDDRGTSFATWRVDPRWSTEAMGEWLGFRLTYVIEFDVQQVAQSLQNDFDLAVMPAVKRQTDALFPPWLETLTLDAFLNEVSDPLILDILQPEYQSRMQQQRDYNLGSRHEAMFSVVSPHAFRDLCIQVRQRSEEIICKSSHFQQALQVAIQRARRDLLTRIQYLERRSEALQRLEETADPTIELETSLNQAIMAAIQKPRVRLDAVGCFIISDCPPDGGSL